MNMIIPYEYSRKKGKLIIFICDIIYKSKLKGRSFELIEVNFLNDKF